MVRRVAVLLLLALGAAHPAVAAERQVPATAADVQLSFAPVVKRVAPAVVEGSRHKAPSRSGPMGGVVVLKKAVGEAVTLACGPGAGQ